MVWFQCEDCGENLKKPKLPNHFRICSAYKLSCIDCGVLFDQESVQGHNQCISEKEKYGPKGQGKANTPAKANGQAKQRPEVDINVGLSSYAPWFCSLCNTNATSKQTLLLHADGKKHRAKARAYHASKQPPKTAEESTPNTTDSAPKEEAIANTGAEELKEEQNLPKDAPSNGSSETNGKVSSGKKRKHDASEEENECTEEAVSKKIKWKKIITKILETSPNGVLERSKLRKHVAKTLKESYPAETEALLKLNPNLKKIIIEKITSSSRFITDENKFVRLAPKS